MSCFPRRVSLVLLLLALLFPNAATAADLVLRGGKIVTMDAENPVAEALAVRGDRIVKVGSSKSVSSLIGPQTRVIELKGRPVIPGFIEGHGHFTSLGDAKRILDLTQASTWEQVVALVKSEVDKTPPGRWILGRGWHQGKWKRPPTPAVDGYPLHAALTRISPSNPVMLTHRAGHMLLANQSAMRAANIDGQTADPSGGAVLRDSAGNATGVFRENAMQLISRAHQRSRARRSAEHVRRELVEAVELATDECLRYGVTSFQDAGSSLSEVWALRELAERGELKVRLWIMLNEGNDRLQRDMAEARVIGAGNHFVTIRAVKRLVDGALGTHGAWMLQPYDDLPREIGHNTTSLESLRRTARLALDNDFQLCVHAIGDRANREVLDLFQETFSDSKKNQELRWRIEHAQHLDPTDIPRFKRLGVIASMQGVHCTSDAPFVIARIGQRRAKTGAYAWRSLLDSGARVINGSDAPVEPVNPIASFYASVTRQLPNGVAFFPEQRMTRHEALRSYTLDAAYAAFEEQEKGSLTAGKLADLVVLSQDLLTVPDREILRTRVELTLVGGQVVYEAKPTATNSDAPDRSNRAGDASGK